MNGPAGTSAADRPATLDAAVTGGWRPRRRRLVLIPLLVAVGTLLRIVVAVRQPFIWDEAFSGVAARLPWRPLTWFLRHYDSHPPLDYLARGPLARHSDSVFLLRAPSTVASIAALVVVAWWMRGRSRFGVAVVAVVASASFPLRYGAEARPYSLLLFLGVCAAALAERWLREARTWQAVAVAGVVLVAMFDHTGGLFLGAGLLMIAGTRTDAAAWRWRLSLAAALLVWSVGWGPLFLDQVRAAPAEWIPLSTPSWVARCLNELVDDVPAMAIVVVILLVVGAVVLRRTVPDLFRVWVATAVVPIALIVAVGVRVHLLLPRTLAGAAWGVAFPLAALVDLAWRRWRALGVAAACLTATLLLPSTRNAVDTRGAPSWQRAASVVSADLRPGDGIVVHPGWLRAPVWWSALRSPPRTTIRPPGWNAVVVTRHDRWNGRVWIVETPKSPAVVPHTHACADTMAADADGYRVRCVIADTPGRARPEPASPALIQARGES